MTVKCLNSFEQEYIVASFVSKELTIDELALKYSRSRRTIIRVIQDQSIDPGIKTRAKKVVKVPVVIPTKTPWYRRAVESVQWFFT